MYVYQDNQSRAHHNHNHNHRHHHTTLHHTTHEVAVGRALDKRGSRRRRCCCSRSMHGKRIRPTRRRATTAAAAAATTATATATAVTGRRWSQRLPRRVQAAQHLVLERLGYPGLFLECRVLYRVVGCVCMCRVVVGRSEGPHGATRGHTRTRRGRHTYHFVVVQHEVVVVARLARL